MNLSAKTIRHLITRVLWTVGRFCAINKLTLVPAGGVLYKNGEEGSGEEEKECGNCGGECGCDK